MYIFFIKYKNDSIFLDVIVITLNYGSLNCIKNTLYIRCMYIKTVYIKIVKSFVVLKCCFNSICIRFWVN